MFEVRGNRPHSLGSAGRESPPLIYKGPKRGTWNIQLERGRDAGGKRLRLTRLFHGSHKQAEDEEARLKHEIATGLYVEPSRETVQQYLERWLKASRGTLAPSTYHAYARIIALRWTPTVGMLRVQELRGAHIAQAESDWLEGGRLGQERGSGKALSRKTVLNFHRVLHDALEAAVKETLLAVNPCDHMQPPKYVRPEMHALSDTEAVALLAVLAGDPLGVALHTLLGSALRAGEVLGLRWRDVDLEGGVVRVVQQFDQVSKTYRDVKTHRSRRPVPIDAVLVADLRRHQVAQKEMRLKAGALWQDTGLVFTDEVGGGLNHKQLAYALDRALRAAGLGHLGPHALRHTHASLLILAGTHMKVVQERLGHASYAITADTYAHVAPGLGEQAAADFRRVVTRKGAT